MAMMMTGRVLLVCALCVLWCGAGGVYAWDLSSDAALHKKHYGANGTYCRLNSSLFFCKEKGDASKGEETVSQASTAQSGTGSGQPNAGGSSGGQDHGSEKNGSDELEKTEEGTQASQQPNGNVTETPTTATVTAAQTSAMRTPDESDGSPAASHTTSPLLLFLVACAAAAAVVAA
ncbi:mucin-associated surface protein (MASP), putative [Trypanosoma cruzi]|uniref:Mucin-associated surface protein (MASP), putative n=1 Tax=Trypanosoma cruzi (strain CL Brener) TaxID=353153 RepID=Q4CQ75_TRYCC|nr:mucin-associated surface protein (MASP), putative [Trypanosoma cruzi]EAN82427.1 mucin-associated surface protein (MASP), putative [Trypanosoma cruzi]|eukprot:XP_804278.1 mucin-associated surface protein (MASP) [Trypanosoma cruzi strain CL Brener]